MADIGDIDGDGFGDLIVGTRDTENPDGYRPAYAFSGRDGSVIQSFVSPDTVRNAFGHAVSGVNDVDGDGVDDIVIGAPFSDAEYPSRVFVFSGANGSIIHTLILPSPSSNRSFGYAVSDAGDLDADGCSDIVIGAPYERQDESGFHGSGRAYVFSGGDGSLISRGSYTDSAVIAIIDIGFRVDHIDLKDKWRRNPTEVVDGADNDGNGYIDDEYGWSFRTNSPINSSTTTVGNIDDDMLSSGTNLESDTTIERTDDPKVYETVDIFTRAK